MKIKINNTSRHPLPRYHTAGAAAFDLTANLSQTLTLVPMERSLVPTGLFVALPEGYEAQIRPRSGLAYKQGIGLVNTPGTIDSDYRGEWKVLLINLSAEPVDIRDGDRIAQVVIARYERAEWDETADLDETDRGAGGFGHTGVNEAKV